MPVVSALNDERDRVERYAPPMPAGLYDYDDDALAILKSRRRSYSVAVDEMAGIQKDLGRAGDRSGARDLKDIVRLFQRQQKAAQITVDGEFEELAFSFIDGGPELMVQEECHVEFEVRFFCIAREIVTHSPIHWALTPLDRPLPVGTLYRTPKSTIRSTEPSPLSSMLEIAKDASREMAVPHASIDCAMIYGKPGIVEMNPMCIGQLGLYAADVRALAKASRKLLDPEPIGRRA